MSENRYGVISGMRSAKDRQLAIARLEAEGIPAERILATDPEEPNALPVWLNDLSADAEHIAPSLSDLNLSTQGIAATVEAARELGIHIRCLDEAFDSRNDWQSQIDTLLTALNRLDRKGFSDRTKIALQEVKARGQRLGRKPSMTNLRKAVAIQMIEAGYKGTKIWKALTVLEGSPLSQSAYSIRSLRNSALRSRLLNGCVRNRAGACGQPAADTFVWPAFSRLMAAHPEIEGELCVENRYVDIVAERFDIGIRMRDDLEMDMVSVPVGRSLRAVVVGAPGYLTTRESPRKPRDLSAHRCIGFRNFDGTLSPWSFEKDGQTETVKVSPSVIVNDGDALVDAALAGLGLAYMLEDLAAPFLKSGTLVDVLADWCPRFPGYHAFYSSRRQPTHAFTLFLEVLREEANSRRNGTKSR